MFLIDIRLNRCVMELLKFVRDKYKYQKLGNQLADSYVNALEYVPECCKTQEMCHKAVDTHPSSPR